MFDYGTFDERTFEQSSLISATNVNLLGASVSGAVGSFTPSILIALNGNSVSGQVGSFVPSVLRALSSVFGIAGEGSFSIRADASPVLSGANSTSGIGLVIPTVGYQLDSVEASEQSGSFAPSIASILAGIFSDGLFGSVAVQTHNVILLGQGNYFFQFSSQLAAYIDPIVGSFLRGSHNMVPCDIYDTSESNIVTLPGWWCMIVDGPPANPILVNHPNLQFLLDRDAQFQPGYVPEGKGTAIVINNLNPKDSLANYQIVWPGAAYAVRGLH